MSGPSGQHSGPETLSQAELMHAAQRAAGVLAARQRGDHEDATLLMTQFADCDELASGSLLLAQLSLGLYARMSGRSFDEVASELSLQLEAAVAG